MSFAVDEEKQISEVYWYYKFSWNIALFTTRLKGNYDQIAANFFETTCRIINMLKDLPEEVLIINLESLFMAALCRAQLMRVNHIADDEIPQLLSKFVNLLPELQSSDNPITKYMLGTQVKLLEFEYLAFKKDWTPFNEMLLVTLISNRNRVI
jgi:hypothetical protein